MCQGMEMEKRQNEDSLSTPYHVNLYSSHGYFPERRLLVSHPLLFSPSSSVSLIFLLLSPSPLSCQTHTHQNTMLGACKPREANAPHTPHVSSSQTTLENMFVCLVGGEVRLTSSTRTYAFTTSSSGKGRIHSIKPPELFLPIRETHPR